MDGRIHLALALPLLLAACDDAPAPALAPRAGPGGAAMGDGLLLTEEPGDPLAAVVCADGPTVPGIDVSKWQGSVNWPAVAGDGQKFAFIRVSDGLTYIDELYEANWQGARQAGLIVGAYQYFRPGQDAIQQADLLLQKMGPLVPGVLPPVIDVETADGLPPAQVAAKVGQWIDRVEGELGVRPIIYTGKYIWQSSVGSAAWADYPLWIAQYGPVCPDLPVQWADWVFWQTSSTGKVAGVSGNVDTNLFNGDLAALQALADQGGPATCGDGACQGAESSDTCPLDCPPCGLIPPEGGVIDDPDACFRRFGNPKYWYTAALGWQGNLYWTHAVQAAAPDNYVIWELHFAEAGTYRAEVHLSAAQATAQATVYRLVHAGGEAVLPLDQSAHDGWAPLGDFTFQAGGHGQRLRLDDNTGEPFNLQRQIVFDALRLTRLDLPEPTTGASDSDSDSGGTTSGATDSAGTDSVGTDAASTAAETEGGGTEGGASESASDTATTALSAGLGSASEGVGGEPDPGACACRGAPGRAPLLLLPLLALRRRRARVTRPARR